MPGVLPHREKCLNHQIERKFRKYEKSCSMCVFCAKMCVSVYIYIHNLQVDEKGLAWKNFLIDIWIRLLATVECFFKYQITYVLSNHSVYIIII